MDAPHHRPIIIGSGIAGLAAALAIEHPCILVTAGALTDGSSSMLAQGGLAAAIGADDSPDQHAADTQAAGCGLCDPGIVQSITAEAPDVVQTLLALGTPLDLDAYGAPDLHLEAAHSHRRIVHAHGDRSGAAVTQALARHVRALRHVTILEHTHLAALHTRDGMLAGVTLRTATGDDYLTPTSTCILATGGACSLLSPTTVPNGSPANGLAAAMRAGAANADLEFIQFHPTALAGHGEHRRALVSEAVRGAGAVLIDETGNRFTEELQPRDVVARAIAAHIAQGHQVFLDARSTIGAAFAQHFPGIYQACQNNGIDPVTMPIPVQPAAHYHMGGLTTDALGRTSIPGLYAAGEVARTGLHGANRLASNSLLEAFVMGRRAGRDVAGRHILPGHRTGLDPQIMPQPSVHEPKMRHILSQALGILRCETDLAEAHRRILALNANCDPARIGLAMIAAARARTVSIGSHCRTDEGTCRP